MKKLRVETKLLYELTQTPNISLVCKKLDISRNSLYRWMREDREFSRLIRDALDQGERHTNDMVENKFMKKILTDEHWPAMKYYMDKRHPKYIQATIDPKMPLHRRKYAEDDYIWEDLEDDMRFG